MSRVPHVSFVAALSGSGDDVAPGRTLAQSLYGALLHLGLDATAPEAWRDVGWSVTGSNAGASFEVVFARIEDKAAESGDHEFLLAVSPRRVGSWLEHLLGRDHDTHDLELRRITEAVHAELIAQGAKDVAWCWNGIPRALEGVSTPEGLSWSA